MSCGILPDLEKSLNLPDWLPHVDLLGYGKRIKFFAVHINLADT